MWSAPRPKPNAYRFRSRKIQIIKSSFQWRYSLYLLGAVLISMIIGCGPIYYFLNQNYEIFINLAYQHSPEIVEHLERERTWINGFLLTSILGIALMCVYFGLRITARIIRPLIVLEKHMQGFTRGQFDQKEIRLRENDEFDDLIQTYNYLFRSLKANTLSEFEALINFKLDKQHRDSYLLWKRMIEIKGQQLSLPVPDLTNESFSAAVSDLDSHRAS